MTKNNLDFASMSSGGSNARYHTDRKEVEIERMKTTGDIKKEEPVADLKGVAKASPNFKPVIKDEEQDAEAKAKALAEKTKPVTE